MFVDQISIQIIADVPLNFIGRMNNYPNIAPERVSAELTIYTNRDGVREVAYLSNGIWRDDCAYNFYFPDFTCRRDGENLYFSVSLKSKKCRLKYMILKMFVRDDIGFSIQRGGAMTCTGCKGNIFNWNYRTCFIFSPSDCHTTKRVPKRRRRLERHRS